MSLRLRLIVAFLVLSVVPLGAMTWFSYTSSVKAVRDAAEKDSNMLAGELTSRMQQITATLGERMEHLMDMDAEGVVASVPPAREQTARASVRATPVTPGTPGTGDAGVPRPAPAPVPAPPAPPAPPPPPDPALAAAASSGEVSDIEARVAVRLGDAAMLLNNIEITGLPPAPNGRRGGRGGGPSTDSSANASANSSSSSAPAASGSSSTGSTAPAAQSPPSASSGRSAGRPTSRGQSPNPNPNRGSPRGPRPPRPEGAQPSSTLAGAPPREPPIRPVGPMLPPPPEPAGADGDRIRIDFTEMRREMFRQISPNKSLTEMDAAERAKVFAEINQRMLGIQQGIQQGLRIGAAAIQKEADEAKREAAAEVAASPSPKSASAPAGTAKPAASIGPAKTSPTPRMAPVAPKATSAAAAPKAPTMTGNRINVQRERNGVMRQVNAEVNVDELMAMVFSATPRALGEVPFAIAKDGRLYASTPEDRRKIEACCRAAIASSLGKTIVEPEASARRMRLPEWTVVTTADPTGSGFSFGIARPVATALNEIRRTAARSAGLGMLFILVTLIAVVPLSNGLTRNLSRLNAGVHRIAGGDYMARVSVKGQGEMGRLAQAFNQMAEQVSKHQQAAIGQERIRRELELGRQIQHDMLPREVLRTSSVEARGGSTPAGEVGGDFFNYFETNGGEVALLIGDVSGKGVGAALLMANIQASLRTRLLMGQDLKQLADEVDRDMEANTPGPVYATLFVAALDVSGRRLRYVNAGHNPQYLLRRKGGLIRLESSGLPIGLLAGRGYAEGQVDVEPGDVLFCYTDGCVEAENRADEMFGADALERELLAAGPQPTEDLLRHMASVIQRFRNGREPADDATMMVARVS